MWKRVSQLDLFQNLAPDESTIQNGDICIIMISLQGESSINAGMSVRKPMRAETPQERSRERAAQEEREGLRALPHPVVPFLGWGVGSYLNIQTGRSVALRSSGDVSW